MPATSLAAVQREATRLQPGALRWLEEWLRIPSISGDATHRTDVQRAAEQLAGRLRRSTRRVTCLPGRFGPTVLARFPGRSHDPVVVYGHLDVKPGGPGWSTPPFEPRRQGRRLVARGASDDKGQLLAHLVAIEAWIAAGGLPCDVVLIVESAEEIGSPGLADALASRAASRALAGSARAVVVSDTRMAAPGVPSLTVAQRGLLGITVTVDAGGPAVHAGRFGGAVIDPSQVLAAAMTRASTTAEALRARGVPRFSLTPDDLVRRAAGGRAVHPDRLGLRSTLRGALTVTSLRSAGSPGAVARTARATLDVRVPPGVPIAEAVALVERSLRGAAGTPRIDLAYTASAAGFVARHSPQVGAAVDRACRAGFGRRAERVASGGTIPAVLALRRRFEVSPVLLGLGPVDDGAHGPDEYLDLELWAAGVRTSASLLAELSRISHANASAARQPTLVDS